MLNAYEIENVEALRRRPGVENGELRRAISLLRVGDVVKLVFLSAVECFAGETLRVRITRIRDGAFVGRVVSPPTSAYLTGVQAGSALDFAAAHIHSIPRKQPANDR